MKRLVLALFLLTACNGQGAPLNPQPSVNPSGQNSQGNLFGNALSKRTLSLDLFANAQNGNDASAGSGTSESSGQSRNTAAGAPVPAPQAPAADIAVGRPGGGPADAKLIAPWFGGEFNQYVLQYAEENVFPAATGTTLLGVYNQTVAPLVKQWDGSSRLVESQAFLGKGGEPQQVFYLPDANGKPQEANVRYMYRLVSSERKESLVVYVTDSQTRVHRMVWGEPNIDLSSVKLDSGEARSLAEKAFNSKEASPGYPVYPDGNEPYLSVVYEVPSSAKWQITLNQHSGQNSRYFVSVHFPAPQAPDQQEVYGSAEIDAVTGKLLQLNRPVWYRNDIAVSPPCCKEVPAVDAPPPPEALM